MTGDTFETDERADVVIESLGDMADGIAFFEDKPLYVSDVIPGERVRVRIRKRFRKNAVGVAQTILEPSPDRVDPRCPLVGTCSGCQFQHVAYERQLAIKEHTVRRFLKAANVDLSVLRTPQGSANPWHYRNHGRFTVHDGEIGFVQRRQKKFFRVDHCYLMDPGINDILDRLQAKLPNASQCNVRVGSRTGDRMVQPALGVEALGVESGQETFTEELGGRRFRVSAPAFFQVNTAQAERMTELIGQRLQLTGTERVVDAYAGVGTFAAMVASGAREVVAIEESGPAMKDAEVNLHDLVNVQLQVGRTEDRLETLEGPVDRLILDPPRRGCHPRALAAVERRQPARIIYVSCEPQTLARDLARLQKTFEVVDIQPVDMFPHTKHVEVIATLARRAPVD